MRTFIYLLLVFTTFNQSYSQELLGKDKTIEITQYWFFNGPEFNEPERKEIKVFDEKGRLIKDIEFGFHHNRNLKLIGDISSYEYKKDKLISEKSYESETDFKNNQVRFYWNYIYEDSKKMRAISNLSSCEYKYDEKNRLKECITTDWNSEIKRCLLKYNAENKIIEKTYFYNDSVRNRTTTFAKKGDTLISKEYFFNNPKEKDTTITTIKEVYKNNRLQFSRIDDFGICERQYVYDEKEQLILIFAKVFDDPKKDLKTELTYFQNGLIKQIRKYEFENNDWVLKQRTDFNVTGRTSILNKKEIKNINQILIKGEKSWINQWL